MEQVGADFAGAIGLCGVLGRVQEWGRSSSSSMRSQVPRQLCDAMAGEQLALPLLQSGHTSPLISHAGDRQRVCEF